MYDMPDMPVIVTRPIRSVSPIIPISLINQAESFSQRVTAMGRTVVRFPLLEIHPLTDYSAFDLLLADLSAYALVAFVSPNAIQATFARLKNNWHNRPMQIPIAVMGTGSLAALDELGITTANTTIYYPRNPDRTDSETLLDELDIDALRHKKVLIIRGETGRELLADALRSKGIDVAQIAAYRRTAPEFTLLRQDQLGRLLQTQNQWVITSSEALQTLLSWTKQLEQQPGFHGIVAKLQQQHLILPHVRIAETAKNCGFQSITLTGSGDEHLLVALQSRL